MTTTLNTHSLLAQYLPTISPFGIDGNTSTQIPSDATLLPASDSAPTLLFDSAPLLIRLCFPMNTILLPASDPSTSPPLTSMSKKKHSSSDLVAKQTPPVVYKHLGNSPDIQ
jgi:hypothetical protein